MSRERPCRAGGLAVTGDRTAKILELDEALPALRAAGVVGTATGEPVHTRIRTPTATLLVNAVESEPSFTVYTLLMERSSRELAEMLRRLGEFGYRKIVLAVNEWTIDESDALIDRASEGGFEVAEVPGHLSESDPSEMIRHALHRHPEGAGATGVTILNLETIWHMHRALFRGKPMTTKLVQMGGEIDTAFVYEAPLGTLASDLAAFAGADPDGTRALALDAGWRRAAPNAVLRPPGTSVDKTTDAVVVEDAASTGPVEFALETIGPPRAIEDVAARVAALRLRLLVEGPRRHTPLVKAGDRVRRGERIASAGADGVDLHAPLDATVSRVDADAVALAVLR